MPGKSRHRKEKRLFQRKKQTGIGQPAAVVPPSTPARTNEPIIHPKAATSPAGASMSTTRIPLPHYPYVNRELRAIALLAGIILVLLTIVVFISH